MALIECHECGKQISDTAKTCPSCGAKPKDKITFGGYIFLAFIALFILMFIFGGGSQKPTNANAINVPSDPNAEYSLIESSSLNGNPLITIKRYSSQSGELFAKIEFDCTNQSYKLHGESDYLEGLKDKSPDFKMSPIFEGSIKYDEWIFACKS